MSKEFKQVADMQPATGVPTLESNEYQRRWKDERWERAVREGNYDRTRDHLNFEVARGGIVQKIDKTRTVGQKIADRLNACGIKDPNVGRSNPNIRVCAKFIFGGSREQMHRLAFGDQQVDLNKGADNSRIVRKPEIEEWAKDIYRFACKEWGEDNIMGFYVHLDETNPHIHCTVLPITKDNKLSFKQVFSGTTKWDYRDRMLAFHDRLAVYNRKWGLGRGTNIYETGARHRSTEEYRRDLSRECTALERQVGRLRSEFGELDTALRRSRTKKKGLSTMVRNLEQEKGRLLGRKAELEQTVLQTGGSREALSTELAKLTGMIAVVENRLEEKQGRLREAEDELSRLQDRIAALKEQEAGLQREVGRASGDIHRQIQYRLSSALLPEIVGESQKLFRLLDFKSMDLFSDSLLNDLAERGEDIMHCALLLFAGYVDQATTFAEGHGGGGGGSDMKWGRDDDEDDRAWALRCMQMARRMLRPQSSGRRKR